MVSLEEVEKEILELEKKDTCWAVCERLAWLYVIKKELSSRYSRSAATEPENAPQVGQISGSEFLDAVSGKDLNSVMAILNEHFEAIKVLYPKEHDAILERIRSI